MKSGKVQLPVAEAFVGLSLTPSNQSHEPPRRKSFPQEATSFFGGWYYVWEAFGILVSDTSIIAICFVVNHFDDNEVPDWTVSVPGRFKPFRLTINSLLSILSVLGSTCAIIPVTKGLAQLKYLCFMEQDRKLADLEVFNSASREKSVALNLSRN
ncbi:hypothetical protein CGLO_04261 [Colletotrichum gloeosporioides Cg-14]|uniref:Uncharacterized protein n=1 Tax=Colletotrichum gloeosporioides (strain Cg-14) TaxID=1237896 RepID=T0KT10_COLGC|nr:hypothetical protein CGLO_04261 [Colletotrichum gloeosporioides Cg-14]